MATDFIDRLRNASFPTARRGGYDPEAVDAYLRELADWLETGGEDQSRAALVQREMERVGERTGTILAAAQESADKITSDARAEADQLRADAEREAQEGRVTADDYSTKTRAAADERVRISAEAAAREAAEMRAKADSAAREKVAEADALLQRAREKADRRTRGINQEIGSLVRTRDEIVANLEELSRGIQKAIEGPGSEVLDGPDPPPTEAEGSEPAPLPAPQGAFDAGVVGEHPVVGGARDPEATPARAHDVAVAEAQVSGPRVAAAETQVNAPDLAAAEPAETQVSVSASDLAAAEPAETQPAEPVVDDRELDPTELIDASPDDATTSAVESDLDPDEQERLQARERELERRRDPRSASDETSEDSSLSDFL